MPKWLSVALLLLLLTAAMPSPRPETHYLEWGLEPWQCGDNWFAVRIGDGSPVWITSLQGNVSWSAQPGSYPGTKPRSASDPTPVIAFQRQALLTITSDSAMHSPVDGKVISGPDAVGKRYTQSLDNNYFAADFKQDGYKAGGHSYNEYYPGGIYLPDGVLKALGQVITYSGTNEVKDKPPECLDIEGHVTVGYTYSPPRD